MGKEKFTAGEVKNLTGLSYRQLHYWSSKKTISETHKSGDWRKYSLKELFALMVCVEIREQFGINLESVQYVHDFMLQEEANHFNSAVKMIDRFGFHIYLLTDLRETFIMETDLDIESRISLGMLRAGDNAYIMLKINPIVNKLLSCLEDPIELPTSKIIYEQLRKTSGTVQNPDEYQILTIIRKGQYDRLTLHFKNGALTLIKGNETIKEDQEKLKTFIMDTIKNGEYQQIEIHQGKGSVINHISKTKTIKPISASGQVPARKGKK